MPIKVAIIGAGSAGLASARRLSEKRPPFIIDIYEQCDEVGGTWVYTDSTGQDDYGYPVHSSMYRNLRTNLPKEVMAFPDKPIIHPDASYVPSAVILQYLRICAREFNLNRFIKFTTRVLQVEPVSDDLNTKWKVKSLHLPSRERKTVLYDAVMVCNGHYHKERWGGATPIKEFTGKQMHSHNYRDPVDFENQIVVVVGAGPSGLDIALDISAFATHVYLSHHSDDTIDTSKFPPKMTLKPDIESIDKEKTDVVIFKDGSSVQVDVILFCTGYIYTFPFLGPKSGITVVDNYVGPLHKHVIAIKRHTLAFIGLPFYVCANAMFDLQARYFIAHLLEQFKLPSQEEMLQEEKAEMKARKEMGFTLKQAHQMGPLQGDYYKSLSDEANIPPIPPVLAKLHNESSRRFLEDLVNFRSDRYEIVDDENFIEIK